MLSLSDTLKDGNDNILSLSSGPTFTQPLLIQILRFFKLVETQPLLQPILLVKMLPIRVKLVILLLLLQIQQEM